jgi:LuxR family maltose regulon positive regulatory protein
MERKDNRPKLSIYALDSFTVFRAQIPIPYSKWQRKRVALLLKYLLIAATPVPRYALINEFWPPPGFEGEQARHNLAVTLYDLRCTLCPNYPSDSVPSYIHSSNDYLALNWDDIDFYDVNAFRHLHSQGRQALVQERWEQAETALAAANELYKTDFLLADTGYTWITEERARLKNMRLDLLEMLATAQYRLGRYYQAQAQAETLIQLDPCREHGHQLLMRALTAQGRRAQAVEQYRECKQVLERELGLSPDPTTTELYQSIMSGKSH